MKYLMPQNSPFRDEDENPHLIPEKDNNNPEKDINNINPKNNIHKNIQISDLNNDNQFEYYTKINQIPKYRKIKKVTFDDNLTYINYDEDEYVTNLQLSDNNGKHLPYKEKDFAKYLRLLTSEAHTSKLKPIINDPNKRNKNKKKTNIMKRNIELIKEIEKSGVLYNNSGSKGHTDKKYILDNSKGCRKFVENPQQFFTEELCDTVLLSYNLEPKNYKSRSSSANSKSKEKNNK
jgi:hypothetical protein